MKRRTFTKNILLGAGSLLLATENIFSQQIKSPNFVFFLVDDLGWTDLGCFGSSFYDTPNVDQLCADGMKFTNAYAACPVCSPTRASIMTGKYPARIQTTDYFGAPQPERWKRNSKMLPANYVDRLPHDEKTIAEELKENGYKTFFAGKWHLGPEGSWPENHGFDVNKGGWSRGGPYGGKKYFSPYGNPRLENGPDGEHLPDRLAQEAAKFITENKNNPFFTYVSFYSVHTPLIARKDLIKKYQEKKKKLDPKATIWGKEGARKKRLIQEHAVYAGMVEAMDQAVGKVLDSLKENNLVDNTVVIFMSDNGGLSTSEGHPTSNLPLKAGKGWLYEGGVREPMIINWPGTTEAGSVCDHPVTSTDFYPTILDIANLKLKPKQHMDGVSITPLLKGKDSLNNRALFWHYPHYGNQGGSPGSAIREGDWKLIELFEDGGKLELYNLKNDVGEKSNLAKKNPERTKELHQKLIAWRKEVKALMPTKNPKFKSK